MENRKRNRRKTNKQKSGFQNFVLNVSGDPEEIEAQDWYLDSPDIRLTKVFSVVLVLHIIAIGGILAFKMFDSRSRSSAIAQASSHPNQAARTQRELAGRVNSNPIPVRIGVGKVTPQYRVIAGDTLSGIATKLGVGMDALRFENNITAPDEIFEGMILRIPRPADIRPITIANYNQLPEHPTQVVATEADYMNETIESGQVYEVQKGDSAWGIANKFNVDAKQLLRLNGIDRAEALQAGRMLSIPAR